MILGVVLAGTLSMLSMLPAAVGAQQRDLRAGVRAWSVWAGGSWSDRVGPSYSTIPTQPYALIGLRSEYVLETVGRLAFAYYAEMIPAIVVDGVPQYHVVDIWQPPAGPMKPTKVWDDPAPVYGVGFTPAGLQIYLSLTSKVRLFANAAGGMLWFTRDMPVPDASRLNFSAEAGGGVRIARGPNGILIGAKFHHMSNGYMGKENPGIDGNVLYAGLSRAR
jgi:hypothetical protein